MRTADEVARVRDLGSRGLNNCEISRATGIPRSTVSQWRNGRSPKFGNERTRGGNCARCGQINDPFPWLVVYEYAYLLGLYLGDGCLLRHSRGVYRLHITLDAAYPVIAAECQAAIQLTMPSSLASMHRDRRARMLRGLIHSDGCRVTNRIRRPKKTYTYPRYFFSNRSLDIQGIFCDACDRLGIAWRQDGPWNISVAHRDSVAVMDRYVGPKR